MIFAFINFSLLYIIVSSQESVDKSLSHLNEVSPRLAFKKSVEAILSPTYRTRAVQIFYGGEGQNLSMSLVPYVGNFKNDPSSTLYVRCGATTDYNDTNGITWVPDTIYAKGGSPGKDPTIANPIANVERYWDIINPNFSGEEVPVPKLGVYTVTVYLAELYYKASGKRLFNLLIGDEDLQYLFEDSIDLYALYGYGSLQAFTMDVNVTTGVINIFVVKGTSDNPKINGFSITYKSALSSSPNVLDVLTTDDSLDTPSELPSSLFPSYIPTIFPSFAKAPNISESPAAPSKSNGTSSTSPTSTPSKSRTKLPTKAKTSKVPSKTPSTVPICSPTASPSTLPTTAPTTWSLHVRCGANTNYIDPRGVTWVPDAPLYAIGGKLGTSEVLTDRLSAFERWWDFVDTNSGEKIPVNGSGIYTVSVFLGELYHQAPNRRLFNILIGDQTMTKLFNTDIDLFALYGFGTLQSFSMDVEVTTGFIYIKVKRGKFDNPKINAFSVVFKSPLPPKPEPTTASADPSTSSSSGKPSSQSSSAIPSDRPSKSPTTSTSKSADPLSDKTTTPPSTKANLTTVDTGYVVVGVTGIPAVHMFIPSLTKVHFVNRAETGFPAGMLPNNSSQWTVEYDVDLNTYRLLAINSNQPGYGTGAFLSDGMFWLTGGEDPISSLRYYDGTNWHEGVGHLTSTRWYGTAVTLPAGNILMMAGQQGPNYHRYDLNPTYEFFPNPLNQKFYTPLLDQVDKNESRLTTYPFVFVLPDGYVLLVVNAQVTVFDPVSNAVVKSLPSAPAIHQPDPLTAGYIVLPLQASNDYWPEIFACGGGSYDPTELAGSICSRLNTRNYMTAQLQWVSEPMPSPRVMPDMINLPNGKVLILNGARRGYGGYPWPEGTANWHATDPNFDAVLYDPAAPLGNRFKVYGTSLIARMYHSTAILTYEGSVLVGGSSTVDPMTLSGPYPTEFRAEKFYPSYMMAAARPVIVSVSTAGPLYGSTVQVVVDKAADAPGFVAYFIHPGMSTHGQMMGSRSIQLPVAIINRKGSLVKLTVTMPKNANIAPPCGLHYFLFVTRADTLVPSKAVMMGIH